MGEVGVAVEALNRAFLAGYPGEAARWLEGRPAPEIADILSAQPVEVVLPTWSLLASDVEEALLDLLPGTLLSELLAGTEPARCAALLKRLEPDLRERLLGTLPGPIATELRILLAYPPGTAGELMDPRVVPFRPDTIVGEALVKIRGLRNRALREVFLVDGDGRLTGSVSLQSLALAEPEERLGSLAGTVEAVVQDVEPREEVVEKLERFRVSNLPVVDFDGRLIGVIRQHGLVAALQQEASVDVQTMVGASREERALSPALFAVRKRLPWLQINLLTAFLAASVVALFESTIARFTALAVLLPVVAGQSGNAGAQALAVTMRGLAVREVSVRHWLRIVLKEVSAGLLNGIAIAVTTAAGVYVWSRSVGLALVIAISMVLAMVAAGFSGALIPILLVRLGQDPAQSSSIILTTVTDVVGFFSFLGIASLLASMI